MDSVTDVGTHCGKAWRRLLLKIGNKVVHKNIQTPTNLSI